MAYRIYAGPNCWWAFFSAASLKVVCMRETKWKKKEQFKQCPNTSTAALKHINGMLGLIERKYTKYDVNATRKRLEQRAWRIFTEDIKQIELLPSFWSYSTGVVCYMFTIDAIIDGTLVYLIHIHHVFFPLFIIMLCLRRDLTRTMYRLYLKIGEYYCRIASGIHIVWRALYVYGNPSVGRIFLHKNLCFLAM